LKAAYIWKSKTTTKKKNNTQLLCQRINNHGNQKWEADKSVSQGNYTFNVLLEIRKSPNQ
jgi:hypothetical protein